MAHVTTTEIPKPPPPPDKLFNIILDEREAIILTHILGCIVLSHDLNVIHGVTSPLYQSLTKELSGVIYGTTAKKMMLDKYDEELPDIKCDLRKYFRENR